MKELSPREAEVLELVARHLSNPQIAERLYISVRTVESRIASLIRKLWLADRRALMAYAAEGNRSPEGASDHVRSSCPAEATQTFLFTDVVGLDPTLAIGSGPA